MRLGLLRRFSIVLFSTSIAAAACGGGGTDGNANDGFGGGANNGGGGDAAGTGTGGGIFSTGGGPGTGGLLNADGGPGSGGGTGGLTADSGCATASLEGERLPANLYFVIDRSGSMNCNLPEDGQTTQECEAFPQKEDPFQPSKWELTRTAIKDAMMQLRTTQPDSSAGIVMFPTDNLCAVKNTPDVTVQLLDTGHEASISAFLDTVAPEGSTPLAGATILAYDYLHNQLNNPGNKFVVLLTDGAETCKATELPKLLNMDVPNARLVNIRTFVIGVPGSESARALLSQIAFAGGTPRMPGCNHNPAPANQGDCHFDMTTTQNFSADLADALNAISGTVLTCEFDVPSPSQAGTEVDLNKVNVTINGVEVLQDQTRDCNVDAEGWQFIDNNTKIILCGQPCVDAVVPSTRVDIVLGCPTMVTIPA